MPVVIVHLPSTLAELTGGRRSLELACAEPTVEGALDALESEHPAVVRRIRDETRALRRYINVYVDGVDVRQTGGTSTVVSERSDVMVIPSIAGG